MGIILLRESNWSFRQDIDRDFLQSFAGFLKIAQLVSLATGFSALLHFIKLMSTTTAADFFFMVTAAVAMFLNLILFIILVFNIKKKINANTKAWNISLSIYAFMTALVVLVSSILVLEEAINMGNSFSSGEKCEKCSKINIAVVFGFLSWIFFSLDFFLCLRNCGCLSLVNKTKKRSVTVQPTESPAGKRFPVEATIMELPENEREQSLGTHSEQGTPVYIADRSI